MSPTYTIHGATYEPLTDYLRGWLPGALGLPCPEAPNDEVARGHEQGVQDRQTHGLRISCVANIIWHECRHGNCRKVES